MSAGTSVSEKRKNRIEYRELFKTYRTIQSKILTFRVNKEKITIK